MTARTGLRQNSGTGLLQADRDSGLLGTVNETAALE
jgi:hypothetical protein